MDSNNYRNKIIQNIMEDIKYDLDSFDSDEMTMIQITLIEIFAKYKFSPKEVTRLSLKNHNEEDINNYLRNMALSGCKESSIKAYRYFFKNTFLRIFTGDIRSATKEDIQAFLDYRCNIDKVSDRTLEANRKMLLGLFLYLNQNKIIRRNPMILITPIKFYSVERKPLTDLQMAKLRDVASRTGIIRDRAMVEFFYSTGARVSEIASVTIDDIDIMERTVKIRNPKGWNPRTVLLDGNAVYWIRKYIEEERDFKSGNKELFLSRKKPHKGITKNAIELIFKQLGEECGFHIFPHLIRHTMATNCLNSGMELDQVGTLLGHKCLSSTKIYAKRNIDQAKEDFIRMHCK